jgi:hypothetical protein
LNALLLKLATHGWWPGTPRWGVSVWAAWWVAMLVVGGLLLISAQQWRDAERLPPVAAAAPAVTVPQRVVSPAEAVLARLHVSDPKAAALQMLHVALDGAPGVQLVSAEFSAQAAEADRLDRLSVTFQLRGPYAAVKQVLAQWNARFEAASLLSLRIQRSATTPGVVEATVSAALWTRLAPSAADSTASAPLLR